MTPAAEKVQDKVTPVYIRSADHSWQPVLQVKVWEGKATICRPIFKDEQSMLHCGKKDKQKYARNNETIDLKDYPNNVLPMQNVDSDGNLDDYKDMVELPFMHEAAILYNLKKRHIAEKPYTRTGDIVIAVNPYQWIDGLYSEKKRMYYSNRLVWETSENDPRAFMEPHVYEVSALSYKGLSLDGQDQSILVSGESGAGKTETVKIMLNHIATTQKGHVPVGYNHDVMDPVVQRVVESNPLLEAFGNAKTRRNDNSSRFGKYLSLQFDRKAKKSGLVGSRCEVYLLEKNRVVGHVPEERTFHIFYQLLASSEKTRFWSKLAAATNETFKYVGSTKTDTIEGVKDADRFTETLEALALVGIQGEKLNTLMKSICIVLQLGNLSFKAKGGDSDKSECSTMAELRDLAELMQVKESDLIAAFTERTFEAKNDVHKVPLNAEAAKDACDALAKEAYQKAFLWLVKNINEATMAAPLVDNTHTYGTIGLLDIFGFEAFPVNRFDQLCINYANEKLQQKFTEDVFRSVEAEYKAEGVPLAEITYDDNTDVLDLIEARGGLLAMLNEECIRPKGNDQDFVQKALQQNKSSPCLIVHRTDRMSFGIHHYAGAVMYDAEFFVSRNQDTLPTDLQAMAETSSNEIVKSPRSESAASTAKIVTTNNRALVSGSSNTGGTTAVRQDSNLVAPTVWSKYKNQLSSLMKDLRKTRTRYIRCIKPNSVKAPLLMEHKTVVDQLQCAGVVAGITITRSTFPNRLDNVIVMARYSNMWDVRAYPSQRTRDMSRAEQVAADCQALLKCALVSKQVQIKDKNGQVKMQQAFCVGKTKSFFRAGALEFLEAHRMQGLDVHAVTIQKAARGWLARNQGNFGARQRREYEEQERLRLAALEEAERKARAERAAKRSVFHKKECSDLEKRLAQLQQQIYDSDLHTQQAIRECRAKQDKAMEEMEALRERHEEELDRLVNNKSVIAGQKTKIAENKKLIDMLKKEYKRARKAHDKEAEKHGILQGFNDSLNMSNSEFGFDFDELHGSAVKVAEKNDSISDTLNKEKAFNKTMRDKVLKVQDLYMDQATIRLDLQKNLARILNMIQDQSKDRSLIESCVVIALQTEGDCKAQMAALEAQTGEPGMVGSDVSEGSDMDD